MEAGLQALACSAPKCVNTVFLNSSPSTMAAQAPMSDASGRPLNHLGFIDTSVKRVADGSCELLEAGLNAAVRYAADSCRPCVEDVQRRASVTARKAGHATKERTRSILEKMDPKGHTPRVDCCLKVDRALTSARTMTVSSQDVLRRGDQAADRVASHPRVQQTYHCAKDKYINLHDTAVASPTYAKVYKSAAEGVSTVTSRVKGSRVYIEQVAQYTEPMAQRVKSSSYYQAAVEHVRPAHTLGAPSVETEGAAAAGSPSA